MTRKRTKITNSEYKILRLWVMENSLHFVAAVTKLNIKTLQKIRKTKTLELGKYQHLTLEKLKIAYDARKTYEKMVDTIDESMQTKEFIKTLEEKENKEIEERRQNLHLNFLQVGKNYKISSNNAVHGINTTGKIVADHKRFYLVDNGNYVEAINKASMEFLEVQLYE